YYAARAIHPAGGEVVYGVWFIASIVAGYIVQKPGVALAAEIASASGELLLGSAFGLTVLVYGIAQGLGAEAVLALFRYRRYGLPVLMLAGAAAGAGSLLMDLYYGQFKDLAAGALALTVAVRLLSGALLAGLLGKVIVDSLVATGVLNAYAVARRGRGSHDGSVA
ncbi:MAG TPA: ECF transporter S component, partial [Bacillota bacterium]